MSIRRPRVFHDSRERHLQEFVANLLRRETRITLEEKGRYQCSLQQELSRTLSEWTGVVDARVHIALAERDPLGGTSQDSSASVVIFEEAGANVRARETDIKMVVKDAPPASGRWTMPRRSWASSRA